MKCLIITELTRKGRQALKQHMKEIKKLPLMYKIISKRAGYNQKVVSEDPYAIELGVNNKHSNNPAFMGIIHGQITDALAKNGAEDDVDYKIEVQ